ncbi:RibD family protein [Arthrobacter pigmenti]
MTDETDAEDRAGAMGPDQVWQSLLAGQVPVTHLLVAEARELVSRYAPLVTAGPRLVMAQLGQSADGFIAARSGDAEFVTGEADREHLHRLRALADAVVVGVGTVAADNCRLTVRTVEGQNPVRVVLDPSGRATPSATVFTDNAARTLWCLAPEAEVAEAGLAPHVEVVRLPVKSTTAAGGAAHIPAFDPAVVLILLAERGLGRVLVEGGGRTVSAFLAAGLLDRLFLTTAPVLIGDGIPGVRFAGADRLADALRAPARRFLLGDDTCMELDLAAAQGRA